jgi:hypothetical protein
MGPQLNEEVRMNRKIAALCAILITAALCRTGMAETRQVSWDPVTTYEDGTLIEAGRTVRYTVFWTVDPWLEAETLKPILSSITATSGTFDPVAAGMSEYQTVYFTVKAVLDTGAESSLAMGFPWNVPNSQPAAPAGMAIAKISADGQLYTGQLSWNPVTSYTNGSPIEAGKSASYTVYWTTDPGLAAGTLLLLASSIPGTSTDFSPSEQGMIPNQRVYFTGKTVLSSGEESSLSTGLSWRVSNKGPKSPSSGKIVKK